MHRQYGEYRLQTTSTTKQMPCHGFGGIDYDLGGGITQCALDRDGLCDIAEGC